MEINTNIEEWINSGKDNLMFNQEMQDYYKQVLERVTRALEKGENLEDVKKELILEQFGGVFGETLECMGVPREKFFTPEFMAGFNSLLESQRKKE